MRPIDPPSEEVIARGAAGLAGLMLLTAATLAAGLAMRHMTELGEICGGVAPHCGWCVSAAALAIGGALSVAWSLRPALRALRLRG